MITFTWITSILSLGYARPLEPTDLWKLQDNRSAAVISEKILTSFEKRVKATDEYNTRLANGEISPGWRSLWWSLKGNRVEREKTWREKAGRKKPSLALALNDSVFWWFWSAGVSHNEVIIFAGETCLPSISDIQSHWGYCSSH